MLGSNTKRWVLAAASAALLMSPTLAGAQTNINLAVASNFFGIPPSNSAITDIIVSFQMGNPGNTVTVVDNGATATLEANIIAGNTRGVDLFLAADTETPQDLLINHFNLVTPYNNSLAPALYTFNYAQGVLALLTNSPWINLSCGPGGTCGYDPNKFATAGIADPSLAPYGVASQSVLTRPVWPCGAALHERDLEWKPESPPAMLPEYNGISQRSVIPGSPGGICRDVGNLFQRTLSYGWKRNECVRLFPDRKYKHNASNDNK